MENVPFLAQKFLVWQVRVPVQGPQVGQGFKFPRPACNVLRAMYEKEREMKEDLIYIIAFVQSVINLGLAYTSLVYMSKYNQQKHISAQLLKRKDTK